MSHSKCKTGSAHTGALFLLFSFVNGGGGDAPFFLSTASKTPNSHQIQPQHRIGSLDFSESGNLAGNSQDCVDVADHILTDTSLVSGNIRKQKLPFGQLLNGEL